MLLQRLLIKNAIAYTNDPMLIVSGASLKDAERNMQALPNQVSQWASKFQLSINTEKCFVLPVSPADKHQLHLQV